TRVINKLKNALPDYPIEKAWLFGSYARGEETRKSDVDLLVRFQPDAKIVGLDYFRILNKLEDTLHKKVDLVKEGTLRKFAVDTVEQDKILIYERAS
ncbi:MAG: nucleotidyltransferase domain-containing protein, partial [Prevotellaceae bacterium]|nr:nucleotidyltransferase domain-containing protein [Prevotellaceae bacterium]